MTNDSHDVFQTQGRSTFATYPQLSTTYQLLASIDTDKASRAIKFQAIRETITDWLIRQTPAGLTLGKREDDTIFLDEPGYKIDSLWNPSADLFTSRLVHPDRPYRSSNAVPGRHWIVDISISIVAAKLWFGLRCQCSSHSYSDKRIQLTRPRIALDIASSFPLRDVRLLDGSPWYLKEINEVEELASLLLDPHRRLPIIVISEIDNVPGVSSTRYAINPASLAYQLHCLAHVVVVPYGLGFKWTERVGKIWSVYNGAVRIYYPGISLDEGLPTSHPRTLAERIISRDGDDSLRGATAFSDFLTDQAYRYAANKRIEWEVTPFLLDAQRRDTQWRQVPSANHEWEAHYQNEIDLLDKKVAELAQEGRAALDLAEEQEKARLHYESENRALRARLESLLRQTSSGDRIRGSKQAIRYPEDYDSIAEWVDDEFPGQLALHSRALKGLKNALYEDITLVCKAIEALATHYRDSRLGYPEARKQFDDAISELGIQCRPSITRESAGRFGKTYFIQYPPGSGRQSFLDMHLRKGNSHDPRYCLAIYFTWHQQEQKILVGWLTSHLQNNYT